MSFKERVSQIQLLSEAVKLNILVWGPGSEAATHYEKRRKIRGEIRARFRHADVQFSEDLDDAVPGSNDLTPPERELWHLAACDVCVVLDTSKGAGEEIAHFVGSGHADKLVIFTHEKYKDASSFPAALRKRGNQMFYSDDEYNECNLVARVLTRVRQVAILKMSGLA